MKVDVLGISETHWKDVGEFVAEIPTSDEKFKVIHSGGSANRKGVAIILSQKCAKTLLYYDTYSERIMLVKLKGNYHNTVIIQAYAPTADAAEADIDAFYEELRGVIKNNCKSRDKLVVCGDFNAKVGNTRHEKIVGPYGLGVRNQSGEKLVEFAQQHQLFITNTWFEQKESCRHTWTAPNGINKNQIDYILVNQRYRNSVTNAKARHDVDCGSDHNPVIISTNTKLKKVAKKRRPKKWNLEMLSTESLKFRTEIDNRLQSVDDAEATPNQLWKEIKQQVVEVADLICGKKTKEKKQQWMTPEILGLMEQRRKSKNIISKAEYKIITKNIQRACRKAKENYYQQLCDELERLDKMNSNILHRKVKNLKERKTQVQLGIRTKEGVLLHNEDEITNRWEEYIGEELFVDDRGQAPDITPIEEPPIISQQEVEDTIKRLPNNKAPGEDNIPAEFLKELGPKGMQQVTRLINLIYRSGKLPDDFLVSNFITIPKVSKATKCSDFRTISLIPHASKILLKIMLNRINPIIEKQLSETQLGFRKGRGTRDGIFLLRCLSERMIEKQQNLYLCFIDYTKAFDRVNHCKLLDVMEQASVPEHERKLVAYLYWHQTASIRTAAGCSNKVSIQRGVRQGCILSPALFNLYSELLLKEAMDNCTGVMLNGINLTNIRYADDTVLLASNVQSLQMMLDALCSKCKEYRMELNAKKTKTMCISKTIPERFVVRAEDKDLEQVHEYQYLGTTITEDGKTEIEIKRRIGKAKAKFWECKEFLRRNINVQLKVRLLRCYVFSVVAYGCEAWHYTNTNRRMLHSFEMWCLRRMLRISWKEKVSNEEVLLRAEIKRSLVLDLMQRKMSYAGHILRGSGGELPNVILEGRIEGSRSRGRPRGKWSDDIKLWSNSNCYADAKRTAENRSSWRSLVANLRLEDGT